MNRTIFLGSFAASLGAQTYTISTVAGGALPVNGLGTSASLGQVADVAVDGGGNVFIVAPNYNLVLRLDAASHIVTAVAGNGIAGYSGDQGPATSAEVTPQSVAVDSAGDLFIADGFNNRIRKIANGVITTIAGTGAAGFSGDNGPATSAELNAPWAIALDSSGNVFFADYNNSRVREISTKGLITTVAGNGIRGLSGDNGAATSAEIAVTSEGIAIDSQGNLYIADGDNGRVRKVTNGIITTIAGTGSGNATGNGDSGPALTATLDGPRGLAVDHAGDLFITESIGDIRKISNGIITTVAGTAKFGFAGDGGPATAAEFENPAGIAVDSSGKIFIADEGDDRVREISNGIINTIAGNGSGFGGDNGPATAAALDIPLGVAVSPNGDLFILDFGNSRVRKVSNGVITTAAGNGLSGLSGDGGPATGAQLYYPYAVAVDPSGNLFIMDSERVQEVSGGVISTFAGSGQYGYSGDGGPALRASWAYSQGLTVDEQGNVYIADTGDNRIRKISNGIMSTVAGDGEAAFSGDGGSAVLAALHQPWASAVDASGNVFIADAANARVREVSTNGIITTIAGNGVQGHAGDGGVASSAELSFPSGVAVDSSGILYIADGLYVRKVSGGVITTIAGGGTAFGDGGPATSALFAGTLGIALDFAGDVYVSDSANDRVRVLTPSGVPCTYAVTPSSLSTGFPGGSVTATIQTGDSCAWAVQNLPDWITLSGGTVSVGNATVSFSVSANSGAARAAQVSIAGFSFSVNQASGMLLVGSGAVVDAASYTVPVAPGSIAAAFGTFLLPQAFAASSLPISTNLAGLSLQFGGAVLAPLFYANSGQVNAQIPWELAGQPQATVTATLNGQTSVPQTVNLAEYAPGIFTLDGSGTGAGAILSENFQVVSATNPTTSGAYIQIYCTGLGPVTNQPATGAPAQTSPLAETTTLPAVTIGGEPGIVSFAGLTPGTVGLYQVNVQVPAILPVGGSAEVLLSIGGVPSNAVTVAVR